MVGLEAPEGAQALPSGQLSRHERLPPIGNPYPRNESKGPETPKISKIRRKGLGAKYAGMSMSIKDKATSSRPNPLKRGIKRG